MDFLKTARRRTAVLGILLALAWPPALRAQLSPGKLAGGHAGFEGLDNCAKCHSGKVRSGADPALCRACHEPIDARMKSGRGLHGGDAKFNQCGKCHPDHLGRDFPLVQWKTVGASSRDRFDHLQTGYKLEGAHIKVKCSGCHQPKNIRDPAILAAKIEFRKNTFLGLGTECLACHKDVHGKMFGKKRCLDCHDMDEWKPARGFNHDRDTRFVLRGKHIGLECAQCHKGGQPWELPPNRRLRDRGCITCHQDVHKGKFGRNCAKCHQEDGFRKIKVSGFNHDKTRFPLLGRHAEVACNECHKNRNSWVLTRFRNCSDCHDNFHKGEFIRTAHPEKCESCHAVEGFVPANFGVADHARTDFPLKDAHLAIPCAACHTAASDARGKVVKRKFRFASTDCIACHSDPHRGQVDRYKAKAGCLACHSGAGWEEIHFDHGLTGYPLTGRHTQVGCRQCHTAAFAAQSASGDRLKIPDFGKRRQDCFQCHEDPHQGQFREQAGPGGASIVKCDRCHTTTDWFAERFDHDSASRFKLEGAHEKARCEACHNTEKSGGKVFVRYKPLPIDCRACHGDSVQVK